MLHSLPVRELLLQQGRSCIVGLFLYMVEVSMLCRCPLRRGCWQGQTEAHRARHRHGKVLVQRRHWHRKYCHYLAHQQPWWPANANGSVA